MNHLNRRNFLKTLTIVSVSVVVAPSCKKDKDDDPSVPTPGSDCETTSDILGPFYKKGAPFREDIIPAGETGIPLIIKGKVYGDCENVLKDALVEIWNANADGEYDTSNEYKFRGSYKTSGDGNYQFKTIVPGRYLNGDKFRPSHIHFKITAPGHLDLVSQIYFKDDPFISSDSWANAPKAKSRILTLEKNENEVDTATFDIYLLKS